MTTHIVSLNQARQRQLHRSMRYASFMTMGDRLRLARTKAGFDSAAQAAEAFGWKESTYRSHENGTRGFPAKKAPVYAKAFRVREEWLLLNKGEMHSGESRANLAEESDRLMAIHRALPDAASRAELLQIAETVLLAAKARQQQPRGGRDPENQGDP